MFIASVFCEALCYYLCGLDEPIFGMKLETDMNWKKMTVQAGALIVAVGCLAMEPLYTIDDDATTRWASYENTAAEKGQGGMLNEGAKGAPYVLLGPNQQYTLLNVDGAGIIHRIWLTVDDLYHVSEEWRALKIEMFWDGCETPAVSAPLEDFFCQPLGRNIAMENALFASPEGRSAECYIPMPFRTGAKIVITNESKERLHRVFFDVNFSSMDEIDDDALYFHAHWRREAPTTLGQDFVIMPKVSGKGRFLGCNVGVVRDQRYLGWWGEGEVKIFLDGDSKFPSLCGTGTEDYIGTGWGQGFFVNQYTGSHLANDEKGLNGFYRFHIPDPVQFQQDCKVTLQQIGGTTKKDVETMIEVGLPVKPVAFIHSSRVQHNLLGNDAEFDFDHKEFAENVFVGFYREDDLCATSYFYLDSPVNDLPSIPGFDVRNANLRAK